MSNAHFTTHHVLTSMSKLNWCSLSFENEENRKNFIQTFLDYSLCPAQYDKSKNVLKILFSYTVDSNRVLLILKVFSRFLNVILVIPFMMAADDHFLYDRVAGGL